MKELGILTMTTVMLAAMTIVMLTAIAAYTYHVWDDCLEENSVFTCMRMLNK